MLKRHAPAGLHASSLTLAAGWLTIQSLTSFSVCAAESPSFFVLLLDPALFGLLSAALGGSRCTILAAGSMNIPFEDASKPQALSKSFL